MKRLLLLWLLVGQGPGGGHLRYYVPGEAIDHAELVGCDRSEPPNCRAVTLVYKSGSERLIVRKEKRP